MSSLFHAGWAIKLLDHRNKKITLFRPRKGMSKTLNSHKAINLIKT